MNIHHGHLLCCSKSVFMHTRKPNSCISLLNSCGDLNAALCFYICIASFCTAGMQHAPLQNSNYAERNSRPNYLMFGWRCCDFTLYCFWTFWTSKFVHYQFKINKEDGHIGWLMENLVIFLVHSVFSDYFFSSMNGVLCVLFANQTPN